MISHNIHRSVHYLINFTQNSLKGLIVLTKELDVPEKAASQKSNIFWKKSDKNLPKDYLNTQLDDAKQEKRNFSSSNKSNSTLSLHIAAYENFVEAQNTDSFFDKQLKKKGTTTTTSKNLEKQLVDSSFNDRFDFPRQQEDEPSTPEIQQFTASQKLYTPVQEPIGPIVTEPWRRLRMSSVNICSGDITVTQQIIASSSGAVLTSLMVTPMDVVKIRLQSQVHPIAAGECFLYSNGLMDHLCINCGDSKIKAPCEWYNRPGQFNGTIDAFVKIARNEGIRSLWSGLSPTIVSAIPATVFYFTIYDNLLCRARGRYGDHFYVPLVVGAVARGIAVTIVSPIEMVRTKMQSESLSYTELGKAVKMTVKSDGYLSLWRGLGATILRDIPFSALYWTGYESLKKVFVNYFHKDHTTFSISFASGALSSTFAAVVTLPFDVVKTRRQVTLGQIKTSSNDAAKKFANTSTVSIMKDIVKSQGYRGLFTGITPRIAKIAPACATMIASYDYLKQFFYDRNKNI